MTKNQTINVIENWQHYIEAAQKGASNAVLHTHGKIKIHALHYGLIYDHVPPELIEQVENYAAHYTRSKLPWFARAWLAVTSPLKPLPGD